MDFKVFSHDLRRILNKYQRNNTTGAVYGTGNAYPSGAPDFTAGF